MLRYLGLVSALLILLSSCSPMPGKYGLIDDVKRVHGLDEMQIDITIGGVFETMAACNREFWTRGNPLGSVSSLGLIFGCTWIEGIEIGRITRCTGYTTKGNLEHELQHCRGYADHPLWRF